jgi:hypothetical protein
MIRVAEDLAEYDRHKASWYAGTSGRDSHNNDNSSKRDDPFSQRDTTRARLGLASSDLKTT